MVNDEFWVGVWEFYLGFYRNLKDFLGEFKFIFIGIWKGFFSRMEFLKKYKELTKFDNIHNLNNKMNVSFKY